jgi:hypothetical protein
MDKAMDRLPWGAIRLGGMRRKAGRDAWPCSGMLCPEATHMVAPA